LSAGSLVFSAKVQEVRISLGLQAEFDQSLSWLSEASRGTGISTTVPETIDVFGGWVQKPRPPHTRYLADRNRPERPRYYLPNNKGLALVKSGTADLYALRLGARFCKLCQALRAGTLHEAGFSL
jgi:hypothetical protein